MNLIGVHLNSTPAWPVKITKEFPDAILLNTCNRYQYLCEPKDRKDIVECFREFNVKPIEYENKECVKKLTEISFGLDSVNLGSTIVRKQMLEAKNRSGTPFLKNTLSTIVNLSETLVPYPGFRQFTVAKHFFSIIGVKDVHIVTGGEIVAGGKDCYSYWHPDAFNCEGVIFAGSIDRIIHERVPAKCRYCINFSFRFAPIEFDDLTDIFDKYVSSGGPVIENIDPVADLIWYKIESEMNKKSVIKQLKDFGVSSNELEIIFGKANDRSRYID